MYKELQTQLQNYNTIIRIKHRAYMYTYYYSLMIK